MVHGSGADEASLERSLNSVQPMDPAAAGTILREAKQILDQFDATFFLRFVQCFEDRKSTRLNSSH